MFYFHKELQMKMFVEGMSNANDEKLYVSEMYLFRELCSLTIISLICLYMFKNSIRIFYNKLIFYICVWLRNKHQKLIPQLMFIISKFVISYFYISVNKFYVKHLYTVCCIEMVTLLILIE